MRKIWLGFVFLGTVCSISNAKFYVGTCEDGYLDFTCTCGEDDDDFKVREKVKRCEYVHFIFFELTCEPCDKLTWKDVCPRYKFCKKCRKYGGDSCETCPDNKTGKWCENNCNCQNGGTCDRKGKCLCPPAFEGRKCQEKKDTCRDPGNVQHAEKSVLPGAVKIGNDFLRDSRIQYQCQEGFEQKGGKTIFCRFDGRWSDSLPSCIKASCQDPGPIENGKANPIGSINNVFYIGTSIEYSCHGKHYLNGEKFISCTSNGTWSAKKPECIKVDACENLPIPTVGSVTYSPPRKTVSARRSPSHRSRSRPSPKGSRLPEGRAITKPRNVQITSTSASETIPLPPGLHKVGTTATYDCESRYYELIGSNSRRCLRNGEWSGRPPTCTPVCGQLSSSRTPFIVNGYSTDIGQSPWQVGISLYDEKDKIWYLQCGASLLNEMWVITAAHCVTYNATKTPIESKSFKVYMGKYYRTDSMDDEHVQVREVRNIHIHPDYDYGMLDADIALILLDSPVHLNARVQPICLPTSQTTENNLVEGNEGVVTGWGMDENERYSEKLQQTLLPFVSQENCEKGYEDSNLTYTVTDNMFCAGYARGGFDTCKGDSGGPMVFIDRTSQERKRWVLEGIVSWGSLSGCGNPNQYSGFTQVSRFLDWIQTYF